MVFACCWTMFILTSFTQTNMPLSRFLICQKTFFFSKKYFFKRYIDGTTTLWIMTLDLTTVSRMALNRVTLETIVLGRMTFITL